MSKICTNCGRKVQDEDNFCPYCRSKSFRNQNEIVTVDNSVVHRLFYWNYGGKYVLSKSKVAAIIVFLIFSLGALLSNAPGGILFFAVVFALLTYVLGFAFHQMIKKPSQAKIDNNDFGLGQDLIHFLFFWQNNDGGYALSKTKIISHLIFLLFFAYALTLPELVLFTQILFALVFETPAFFIGYGIHKIVNPNPQPAKQIQPKREPVKIETPNIKPQPQIIRKQVIEEYRDYKRRLDEESQRFRAKEKSARDMIEKRFEPPQLTYTRFIGGVDRSKEIFEKQSKTAYTMIELADEYSPRIAEELEAKIVILDSINDRLEDLINELLLSEDASQNGDVENVISQMDELIRSVKDYDQ